MSVAAANGVPRAARVRFAVAAYNATGYDGGNANVSFVVQ